MNRLMGPTSDVYICTVVERMRFDAFKPKDEREREREKKVGGGSERHNRCRGGGSRNIIWQFGRFPGSAR
jgi:hypothetical protein